MLAFTILVLAKDKSQTTNSLPESGEPDKQRLDRGWDAVRLRASITKWDRSHNMHILAS